MNRAKKIIHMPVYNYNWMSKLLAFHFTLFGLDCGSVCTPIDVSYLLEYLPIYYLPLIVTATRILLFFQEQNIQFHILVFA